MIQYDKRQYKTFPRIISPRLQTTVLTHYYHCSFWVAPCYIDRVLQSLFIIKHKLLISASNAMIFVFCEIYRNFKKSIINNNSLFFIPMATGLLPIPSNMSPGHHI